MTNKRISEILQGKEIKEIYYNEQPVWVQELHGNTAKVGFLNSDSTKDLYIDDLYEKIYTTKVFEVNSDLSSLHFI